MQITNYTIKKHQSIAKLQATLTKVFSGLSEDRHRTEFSIWDTFDWLLYKKSMLLILEENQLKLLNFKDNRCTLLPVSSGEAIPRFWWEFPEGPFRTILESIVDVRALLKMADFKKDIRVWRLLNQDEKTVAKIELELITTDGSGDAAAVDRICKLVPIRGYQKALRTAEKQLLFAGMQSVGDDYIVGVLQKADVAPGVYSSKPNLQLDPQEKTCEAIRLILAHLVHIIRWNEDGIKKDIDSEFLHDFRVSVRRSRVLLGQIKNVLQPAVIEQLQNDLRTLGTWTNRLRDLDVYLLKQDHYEKLLPERLQGGLKRLFQTLRRQRKRELAKIVAILDSGEYQYRIQNIESLISSKLEVANASEPLGNTPIIDIAKNAIYRRHRKILKKGRQIQVDTPDEKLHQLRIDCKKLRYLLEFFASLFPADKIKGLIKQLKNLQENLGDFNDLSVQQDFLSNYLAAMRSRTADAYLTAAASGGLICRLNDAQRQCRAEFMSVFRQYNSPKNRDRFSALFK